MNELAELNRTLIKVNVELRCELEALTAERDGLREALEEVEGNCATEFYQCPRCGEATSTADCNSHYVVRDALARYRALDIKDQPNGNSTEMNSTT